MAAKYTGDFSGNGDLGASDMSDFTISTLHFKELSLGCGNPLDAGITATAKIDGGSPVNGMHAHGGMPDNRSLMEIARTRSR